MSDSIFLLRDDGHLVSMTESGYVTEAKLQELLEGYPQLLSGDQVDPESPRRWLLVLREAGIPGSHDGGNRWSVDHLFLDQDGIPTLVEVKRSSDTRIRREVVGQMLDYAANALVYWPHAAIRNHFETTCSKSERDPDEVVAEFLGSEQTIEDFWRQVDDNLKAQRIRLVFVADVIPPELQRIVEFLNGQMDTAEVLALEVRQFLGEGHRTLVPRVIGRTSEAERAKGRSRPKHKWDEASFFVELEKNSDEIAVTVARRLLAWAQEHFEVWWGEGVTVGVFVPYDRLEGRTNQLFAVRTDRRVEIYFQFYAYKPPFDREDKRREVLERLNEIPGVALPQDSLGRRPSFPLERLEPDESFRAFCEVFEWYVDEVRRRG